ncbi:hypothetical protein QTI24_15785 [Variovorax sp. J22P240]|uniref:hypothetical protein n=1 Tax=unclassified Variovorax TaxID=663243 RepID=UPI00257661E4|nr:MULTISPECIES: hypothetical protein [unclassified Variovorax]MDM0000079.1 hypothetical protein [Variovorax sp. J22P240]MDM0051261.1 hypothetical protein [Variovorax sp. J22R115]
MTFESLRITGRNGQRYELGTPMHVHDGNVHLGTVDPVRVSRDGTEVHIERFLPSQFVKEQKRNFGPLVLLEVTAYLAEQFHGVQTISYSLSREIEMHGDGMKVASARSALLQDIGAEGVTITPRPDHETPGNFVVEGVWAYNERNVAALGYCLTREREIYRQWEAPASQPAAIPALRDRLRQLLARGAGEAGARDGDGAD